MNTTIDPKTLQELKRLATLHRQLDGLYAAQSARIGDLAIQKERKERMSRLSFNLGKLKTPTAFSAFPKDIEKSYEDLEKPLGIKKIFFGLLAVTALLGILTFIVGISSLAGFMGATTVLALISGYFYRVAWYRKKTDVDSYFLWFKKDLEGFEKQFSAFSEEMKNYEQEKIQCMEFAKEYSANYITAVEKAKRLEEDIRNEFEETLKKIDENFDVISKEYHSIDILDDEHKRLAGDIVETLESGRANSLQDALNIVIDEKIRVEEARIAAAQLHALQRQNEQLRQLLDD